MVSAIMNAEALSAWSTLYLAVGILAGMCAAGAIVQTMVEIKQGIWRPALASTVDYALAVPRMWLRWQLNYMRGAPVILLGAGLYAYHLGIAVLVDV
jgi:hypothetical protein